jgi:nitrite reductase/ring-hydroxylating ferredoxin subunit
MALLTVAHVSELSPGEARAVEVGGRGIALFRRDEGWYAIDNTCPHRGFPLAEVEVEEFMVTCQCHGSQFDIRTWAVVLPPAVMEVDAYRVVAQGEDVQIEIP